jgi:exodeoxyribonuclease VII small subunit
MAKRAERSERSTPNGDPAPESFGAAMDRLEAIVARLEGDEALELEGAMALYEQGVALATDCRRRLAGAQLTLTEIAVRPDDETEGDAGA